jgi:2-polyprenyl-3-methyl-5-hydroxy-6-metoxy-1,4-benzoquinol methylase
MEVCCKICGNRNNNSIHIVKEMYFGFKDEFEYLECSNCGCLQIVTIPHDLSKYYPRNYRPYKVKAERSKWEKFRLRHMSIYWLKKRTIVGRILCFGGKKPEYINWFEKIDIDFSMRILDVGCGSGRLLKKLCDSGFTNLTGVEPYIDNDTKYKDIVTIYKKEIFDLHDCTYDLIVLSHSFEHMPQPETVLNKIYDLLAPNAYALIRIPIASSYAWHHYKTNWVQIDAPRHLFLHTLKSFRLLLKKCNLKERYIVYDSTRFQFLGSEGYKKGIPLAKLQRSDFSRNEIRRYVKMSKYLNNSHDGDQACFYLQKTDNNV